MMASQEGHKEIVKLLLDKGANVNLQDRNDRNSPDDGIADGHTEVVKLLLDKGADVNIKEITATEQPFDGIV